MEERALDRRTCLLRLARSDAADRYDATASMRRGSAVRAQRTISIAQSRPSGCRSAGSLSLPATSRRAIALATRHKPGRRPADERSATQAIATRPSAGRSQRRKSITRGERTARSQCLRTRSTAGPRVSRLVDGFRVLEAGALSVAPRHREQPRGRETIPWLVLSETGSATAGGVATALVLATSRHLASTRRVEFGRGALAGRVRAFRALQGMRPRRGPKAGFGAWDQSFSTPRGPTALHRI